MIIATTPGGVAKAEQISEGENNEESLHVLMLDPSMDLALLIVGAGSMVNPSPD